MTAPAEWEAIHVDPADLARQILAAHHATSGQDEGPSLETTITRVLTEQLQPLVSASRLWLAVQQGDYDARSGMSFSDNRYNEPSTDDLHGAWSMGWWSACYHPEQRRRMQLEQVAQKWHTMEEGYRAYGRGKNANEAPYDDAQQRQAWEWGWMVGRYETVERLLQQTQRKLAEVEAEIERLRKVEHLDLAMKEGQKAGAEGKPFRANPYDTSDIEPYTAWTWGWRFSYLMGRIALLQAAVKQIPQYRGLLERRALPQDDHNAVEAEIASIEAALDQAAKMDPDPLVARFVQVWQELGEEAVLS